MRVVYQQIDTPFLTQGKVYDIIHFDSGTYKLLDDTGTIRLFSSSRFKLLIDIRAEKLNDLGV